MKYLTAVIAIAAIAAAPTTAYGQVPVSFLGTWVVDAAGTASRIAADPGMAPENKPGWTERWLPPRRTSVCPGTGRYGRPQGKRSPRADRSLTSRTDLARQSLWMVRPREDRPLRPLTKGAARSGHLVRRARYSDLLVSGFRLQTQQQHWE